MKKSVELTKQQSTKLPFVQRKAFLIPLLLVLPVLFLVLFLFNPSPKYSDLQKEYDRLQIPSDWKVVSEFNEPKDKGNGCSLIELDVDCPILGKTLNASTYYSESDGKSKIVDIMRSAGYNPKEECTETVPRECSGVFRGQNEGFELGMSYKLNSSSGTTFGVSLEPSHDK